MSPSLLIATNHYSDVIMGTIELQITSLTIVYSSVYSGANQRKHQSSASLAFVRGIHRWPVNSPHKWLVTRKMLPFDNVIMIVTYFAFAASGLLSLEYGGVIISLLLIVMAYRHLYEWCDNILSQITQQNWRFLVIDHQIYLQKKLKNPNHHIKTIPI